MDKMGKTCTKSEGKMNGCGYYTNNFEQNLDKNRGLSDKDGCLGRFRTEIQKFKPLAVQISSISVQFFYRDNKLKLCESFIFNANVAKR